MMERFEMIKSVRHSHFNLSMLCFAFLLMCLSLNWATAQASQPEVQGTVTPANTSTSTQPAPRVRIGPGDLLGVTVFDVPELTQAVRVSDTGDATFTLIGRQRVAGLTTDEAQALIAHLLKDGNYIVDPQVSVLIQEYSTQGVSVVGEVKRPGIYPVLGNQGLLDVISEAGGMTEMAGSEITVRRNGAEKKAVMQLSTGNRVSVVEDVQLQPGDKVIVPRAGMVYVIGDVGRPGGFIMQTNGTMSLLQAVAMAAGTTPTSALNSSRLIRRTDSGYTEIPLALKKVMKGSQPDLQLEAEDIVVIPSSNTKRFVYQGVPGALQAAGVAAVYTVHP